jgi:hypothetical protein
MGGDQHVLADGRAGALQFGAQAGVVAVGIVAQRLHVEVAKDVPMRWANRAEPDLAAPKRSSQAQARSGCEPPHMGT